MQTFSLTDDQIRVLDRLTAQHLPATDFWAAILEPLRPNKLWMIERIGQNQFTRQTVSTKIRKVMPWK